MSLWLRVVSMQTSTIVNLQKTKQKNNNTKEVLTAFFFCTILEKEMLADSFCQASCVKSRNNEKTDEKLSRVVREEEIKSSSTSTTIAIDASL